MQRHGPAWLHSVPGGEGRAEARAGRAAGVCAGVRAAGVALGVSSGRPGSQVWGSQVTAGPGPGPRQLLPR